MFEVNNSDSNLGSCRPGCCRSTSDPNIPRSQNTSSSIYRPRVYVIETGGTFSCKPSENGYAPSNDNSIENHLKEGGKLSGVLDIAEFCYPSLNHSNHFGKLIDSTNLTYEDQLRVVKLVHNALLSNQHQAIIITHGTDTMASTAALLSIMIPNPSIPIILTGSMHSIEDKNTDAIRNFTNATIAATSGQLPNGTYIVFGERIIPGHWAIKLDASNEDAFRSIHGKDFAKISDGKVICLNNATFPVEEEDKLFLPSPVKANRAPNIVTIELRTNTSNEQLIELLNNTKYDAFIIKGFSSGSIPKHLHDIIAEYSKTVPIIITSQTVIQGRNLKYTEEIALGNLGVRNNLGLSLDMTHWGIELIFREVTPVLPDDGRYFNTKISVQAFYKKWDEFKHRWGQPPTPRQSSDLNFGT